MAEFFAEYTLGFKDEFPHCNYIKKVEKDAESLSNIRKILQEVKQEIRKKPADHNSEKIALLAINGTDHQRLNLN